MVIPRKPRKKRLEDFKERGYDRETKQDFYLLEYIVGVRIPERVFFILFLCQYREIFTFIRRRETDDLLEDIQAHIQGLANGDPNRKILEEKYKTPIRGFAVDGGIENSLREIFDKTVDLDEDIIEEKRAEFMEYKKLPAPRLNCARKSLGAPRNSRHSMNGQRTNTTSTRRTGTTTSRNAAGTTRRGNLHEDWDTLLEAELDKLVESIAPRNNGNIQFNYRRSNKKAPSQDIVHYEIDCIVAGCKYKGTARVGFLPSKSTRIPTVRVDNVSSHMRTMHPHFAKNFTTTQR